MSSQKNLQVNPMAGEQLQNLIYQWLDKNFPNGMDWQSTDDRDLQMPLEIKMILAFDALEANIDNGGWAQLLWNCLGHWRLLLKIAKNGYLTIGAFPQAEAIDRVWALCEESESGCAIAQAVAGDTLDGFAEFTARSYGAGPDWQELFYHSAPVYDQRLVWLEHNEALVRRAVGLHEH